MRTKRIFAVLVSIFLIAALFSSAFYIALEADHDCSGEDCRVCAQILVCVQTLRGFSLAMIVVLAARIVRVILRSGRMLPVSAFSRFLPVSMKVKLSN